MKSVLQPSEWSKPRGFTHGVAIDEPGKWIVLAGQTSSDEAGRYSGDLADQAAIVLKKIVRLLEEAGSRTYRATDMVSHRPQRVPSRCIWNGHCVARNAWKELSAVNAALHFGLG